MKSNINSVILNIIDEMELEENEKQYLIDALNLEYDNNTKKKPHLDGKYLDYVKKYGR